MMNTLLALFFREALPLLLLLLAGAALVIVTWRRVDTARAPDRPRVCPNPTCRHVNSPKADYCAACGQRLPPRSSSV